MLTPVCRGEKKRKKHRHTVRSQHPITTAVDCISMLTQHDWVSILVSSLSEILELNAHISKMCSAWNVTKFRIKKTCYLLRWLACCKTHTARTYDTTSGMVNVPFVHNHCREYPKRHMMIVSPENCNYVSSSLTWPENLKVPCKWDCKWLLA